MIRLEFLSRIFRSCDNFLNGIRQFMLSPRSLSVCHRHHYHQRQPMVSAKSEEVNGAYMNKKPNWYLMIFVYNMLCVCCLLDGIPISLLQPSAAAAVAEKMSHRHLIAVKRIT